ncbi:MAG: response regulator transcription factor [Pseudomonadota bacterium]
MRVLLLEDDAVSAKAIEFAIRGDNVLIEHTETGEDALELAKIYDFDIAIIDLRLPDMDGCTVVRRMRNAQLKLPVMIVSAVEDQQEKVNALISGADDYLTKPFDPPELSARLQAIVRRSKGLADSNIQIGRMTINLHARSVEIDGQPLHVTAKEYSILELLALRKGMTLSKETFLDHLYGGMDEPEQKIIDVFICKLRKKIAAVAPDAHNIQTVWGHGYVMKETVLDRPGMAEDGAAFEDQRGMDRNLEAILETELASESHSGNLSEVDKLLLTLLP